MMGCTDLQAPLPVSAPTQKTVRERPARPPMSVSVGKTAHWREGAPR